MKLPFKNLKEYATVGIIVVALFTYMPQIYSGIEKIMGIGIKYSEARTMLDRHDNEIKENKEAQSRTEKKLTTFTTIWCISELSKNKKVPQAVNDVCQEWIRN